MKTRPFTLPLPVLLLLAFYATASHAVYAQGPPPPPPARDYFPDKWDEYVSQQGRFRVRFPGKPKESIKTEDTSAGKLETLTLEYKGLLQYSVAFADYENLLDARLTTQQLLEGAKNAVLNNLPPKTTRIVTERAVTIDGHPGYFLHIEHDGKSVVRAEWVIVGKKLYVLVVEGPKASSNVYKGDNDYEQVAMGFINSFHITP